VALTAAQITAARQHQILVHIEVGKLQSAAVACQQCDLIAGHLPEVRLRFHGMSAAVRLP
jgi:hypothetical protein